MTDKLEKWVWDDVTKRFRRNGKSLSPEQMASHTSNAESIIDLNIKTTPYPQPYCFGNPTFLDCKLASSCRRPRSCVD